VTAPEYKYKATVLRWKDGDTVELRVDCGFYTFIEAAFRLYGVDTPERGQPGHDTATEHNVALAPVDSEIVVETFKVADKYGRFRSIVWANGVNVNDSLISQGLAVPYFGGHK
jgi:endonuclease YncB( thermonuclease family)